MMHSAKAGLPKQKTSACFPQLTLSHLIASSSYLLGRWGQQKVHGNEGQAECQCSNYRVLKEKLKAVELETDLFHSLFFLLLTLIVLLFLVRGACPLRMFCICVHGKH